LVNFLNKEDFVMNHRPPVSLTVTKAIEGFFNYKIAEGLSDRTVESYQRQLQKWREYMGEDKDVARITTSELTAYLNWLRNEYVPHSFGSPKERLSPKTVRNFWVTLSSFFTWAAKEFRIPNPMKDVPTPRFNSPQVNPFAQAEVESMLKVCMYSREVKPGNRRAFVMRLPNGHRDQAIILTLLDTGLRAMELCSLRIKNVDTKTGRVEIQHGYEGGAKGGKGRIVYLGKTARRALWRYLAERPDGYEQSDYLFEARYNRPFNPNSLRQLIGSIAERAGVTNAYPHRFRHTFAIAYLRAGGDVFTLQAILGHSSLDMVRRYAMIAELDVENAHRKSSPADNWRL
jgi:integrase/recombinase XerD